MTRALRFLCALMLLAPALAAQEPNQGVRIGLTYQPCTETECLRPVEEWLDLPVRVAAA